MQASAKILDKTDTARLWPQFEEKQGSFRGRSQHLAWVVVANLEEVSKPFVTSQIPSFAEPDVLAHTFRNAKQVTHGIFVTFLPME